jgi:hypothetical protein
VASERQRISVSKWPRVRDNLHIPLTLPDVTRCKAAPGREGVAGTRGDCKLGGFANTGEGVIAGRIDDAGGAPSSENVESGEATSWKGGGVASLLLAFSVGYSGAVR